MLIRFLIRVMKINVRFNTIRSVFQSRQRDKSELLQIRSHRFSTKYSKSSRLQGSNTICRKFEKINNFKTNDASNLNNHVEPSTRERNVHTLRAIQF